ncbi:MAG: hypothetical protein AA908_10175 [Chlorobi bacterium NICIL-2]|nr:MAG: hypothetical protein AA908_10175 [Chlorobi bacterium NICIL-2]
MHQVSEQKKAEVFKQWVKAYTGDLYRWAFHKVGNKVDAEDLVQETFMAAMQQWEKFQEKSSPKTWLMAILNRKIADYYRARYKRNEIHIMVEDEGAHLLSEQFDEQGKWVHSARPVPWEVDEKALLDDPEFQAAFQQCLGDLPPKWLSAVMMKFFEQKKIGSHLSTSGYFDD